MSLLYVWPWVLVVVAFAVYWLGVYLLLGRIDSGHSSEELATLFVNAIVCTFLAWLLQHWFGDTGTFVLPLIFFIGCIVAAVFHSRSREAWLAERRKQILSQDPRTNGR